MSVFLTHQSALAFWRWQREFDHRRPVPVKAERYLGKEPTRAEVRDAARLALPGGSEVHVAVPEGAARVNAQGIKYHRWSRASCRGSYMRVGESVYVSSPEMLFLQMAGTLCVEHLIELGYELCGAFCYSAVDGGRRSCEPVTTPSALAHFVGDATGAHGAVKARSAAVHVLAATRSPREVHSCMLLSLPCYLGGYGLREPEPNGLIVYDKAAFRRYRGGHLSCDLLWRDARFAVEYESDEFHAGGEAYVADSRRRNKLRSLGYDVVTLTNDEMKDPMAMDGLAKSVARALEQRLRPAWGDYEDRKRRLRRLLLSPRARADAAHLSFPASGWGL
ncbi:hypothetical protein [Adlercreutzia faecimuris]|uniref:DUF559 domain-containing protein n=1 Tax=Adlercreutzia faecimuris TaxID=2897341 RepID=A0ABS9WE26_9ACTN|nr:hypothetical protein [Adlercreutzia sp. JBNU-10]MCI2241113.1 hypothetical protein [Adlercreutzia sp. JBNU-10]